MATDDNPQSFGDIRDMQLLEYLRERYPVDEAPEEIYPGDAAYLTSMGYNPNNLSPDLDYQQRQDLSDQLQKAWFSRTRVNREARESGFLEETEPQYQFQSPMGRMMTSAQGQRATPAETELFFDESKYMGDPDKLAAASGVRTLPQAPRPMIQEGAPTEPGFKGTQQPDDRIVFASAPEDVQSKLFHVPESPDYARAVEKALGESPEFKNVPEGYDWGVKLEPHNDRVMYRDPNHGGQYTYLYEPGLNAPDIKEELPKLGTMLGAGIVAALGSGWPLLAPALTDAAIWQGFRMKELREAREGGFLRTTTMDESGKEVTRDWTNREINIQGAKESAMVFGISLATPVVIWALGKGGRTIAPGDPRFEPVGGLGMDKEALESGYDIVKKVFDNIESKESREASLELLSTLSGPEILAYARTLEKTGKLGALTNVPREMVDGWLTKIYGGDKIEGGALQAQMIKFGEEQSGPEARLIRAALQRKEALITKHRKALLTKEENDELANLLVLTEKDVIEGETRGGLDIISAVEAAKKGEIEGAEKALKDIEADAFGAGRVVAKGGVPGIQVSTQMRGALQDLRDDVFEDTTKRYTDFYKRIEAESARDELRPFMVDIEPLMNYAANKVKKMDQSLLADLLDKEGGGSILKKLGRKRAIKDKKGRITGYKPSDFASFQDDLIAIRKFKRQAYDEQKWQLASELKALEQEMKQLRTDTLSSAARNIGGGRGDKLLKEITDLERTYARNKAEWDAGFIGSLLKRVPGAQKGVFGEYTTTDMAFLNKILDKNIDDKAIEPLVDLANKNADIKEMFVNAIKGRYKTELDLNNGAPLTPAQHKTFMAKNDVAMNRFLTKAEREPFKNAQSMSLKIKTDQREAKIILDRINKTPWGKSLTDETQLTAEPQTIFKKLWTSDKFNANRELYDILNSKEAGEQGQTALKSFKSRIIRDMDKKTNFFGTKGEGDVNTTALAKYMEDNGALVDLYMGTTFRNGVKTLETMSRFINSLPTTGARAGERGFLQGVISNLTRVYVGMFTREGRALTAIQVLGGRWFTKKIMSDLAEGEKTVTRLKATKWLRDRETLEAIRRSLVFLDLYTGKPSLIGIEDIPNANRPAGELDIETAPKIPPILRGLEGGTYDTYESYNVGGKVKRSKLMNLKHGI